MTKAKLRLLTLARNDLVQLRRYGRRKFGPAAAKRLSDDVEAVFTLLRNHPHAGAEVHSVTGSRLFVKRGHRIFYRVTDGVVVIQRILHHSLDMPRSLDT